MATTGLYFPHIICIYGDMCLQNSPSQAICHRFYSTRYDICSKIITAWLTRRRTPHKYRQNNHSVPVRSKYIHTFLSTVGVTQRSDIYIYIYGCFWWFNSTYAASNKFRVSSFATYPRFLLKRAKFNESSRRTTVVSPLPLSHPRYSPLRRRCRYVLLR